MDEQPPLDAQPEAPAQPLAAPPEPERYPFWNYFDLVIFFGLAFPSLLIGWALVKGTLAVLRIHIMAAAVEPLMEQAVGYILLFGALKLLFQAEYDRPFWSSLAWKRFHMPVAMVATLGMGTALAVGIFAKLIRTPETKNSLTELMKDPTSFWLMAVIGTTVFPLCEELAFRGLMQPLLARSLGAAPGIILAAIPFGLLHYHEYGDSWRHAAIVAAAGAAFGWMRHATGSTRASTIMHGAYNALFFLALLAQRKGG